MSNDYSFRKSVGTKQFRFSKQLNYPYQQIPYQISTKERTFLAVNASLIAFLQASGSALV